jgi:insulysin
LLQPLSKGDLAVYVKSAIDKKTEPDKDLTVEVTRNWSEISTGKFQFDRLQKEAGALLNVTKDDLINFWRQLYSGNGRRMLITEVIPRNGNASSELPPRSADYNKGDQEVTGLVLGIDDLVQFRRDLETKTTLA